MMFAVFQNTEMLPHLMILSFVAINPRMQLIFTGITKPVYGEMSILFNFAVFEKFGDGEQRTEVYKYKKLQKFSKSEDKERV